MAEKLVLIDASSSIYRAFFALPPMANAAGVPTNATLGFTTMLQKVLRDETPTYVGVVWDSRPKRRKELFADYKANRETMPEDLRAQFPNIRRIVEAFGWASLEHEGEEADDVIATLARQGEAAGIDVVIISTDKDLMQLVSDRVCLLDTVRDRRYAPADVEARFGVTPAQMLDFRSLVGDKSDNIPGVTGIGDKGAAKLIGEYGSLDALLGAASEIKAKGQREKIIAGADDARLSRELSRLRDDLPVDFDQRRFALPEPDKVKLTELFKEFGFRRLLDEVDPDSAPKAPTTKLAVQVCRSLAELNAQLPGAGELDRIAIEVVLEPEEPMSGALIGICLSVAENTAVYLDAAAIGVDDTLEALGPLLNRKDLTWTGFNLKAASIAISRRGHSFEGLLMDTTVGAYLADSSQQVQRPEVLVTTYLEREISALEDLIGKGAKRIPFTEVDADALGEFFAQRTTAAFALLPKLSERLENDRETELYREIEVPLVGVLSRMEQAGVRIDEPLLAALSDELETQSGELQRRIYELAGEEFNINSPKQLQQILFEKLALPPIKKTKTGFSTDESVLEELAIEFDLPREIIQFRKLTKLKSTYVDALPKLVNPETGRIHCHFNQTVASTGRLSASNPNLQNIPIRTPAGQRIREAFIPAEGRQLLSADYSQIELRILAHCSEDAELVEAFQTGQDIHVRTASQVFDVAVEDVSAEQRDQTKAINFGILYGSSAFGIAKQLGIAQSEAKKHIDSYFARYPGVRGFLDRTIAQAREQGYAETLYGRRRYLPDLNSKNRVIRAAAERMATNAVIQGTAADLIKRAMVQIDADLLAPNALDARMILQVHDELLFEVLPQDADELSNLVEFRMNSVATLSVPLEVHLGIGSNWREAH